MLGFAKILEGLAVGVLSEELEEVDKGVLDAPGCLCGRVVLQEAGLVVESGSIVGLGLRVPVFDHLELPLLESRNLVVLRTEVDPDERA